MRLDNALQPVSQTAPQLEPLPDGLAELPMSDAYIRLITGSAAATGMNGEYASRYMADHLTRLAELGGEHAQAYAQAARCLSASADLEVALMKARELLGAGMFGDFRSDRTLAAAARKVLHVLEQGEPTLIPVCYYRILRQDGHMTYLLARKEAETLKLSLFNSGGLLNEKAWQQFHPRSALNNKWQTVATFAAASSNINFATMMRMFRFSVPKIGSDDEVINDDACIYQWLRDIGLLQHDPTLPGHAKQKVGSCTHKGLMAYLAYTLPQPAFLQAKAILLADAVQQLAQKTDPVDSLALPALALAKGTRAHAKAHHAAVPRLRNREAEGKGYAGAGGADVPGPSIDDAPASLATTLGEVHMRRGSDTINKVRLNLTQAVYFPDHEGKYYSIVMSDEPNLAHHLWHGTTPRGSHRLYMCVPQEPRKTGTIGRHVQQKEGRVEWSGPCMKTKVRAQMQENRLVGSFQGRPTSGNDFSAFKGEFKAQLIDIRNRQIVRFEITAFCRSVFS